MKKLSLALLVCLLAFFTACSNDDVSTGGTDPIGKTEPSVRLYGVKESKKPVTRGVAQRTNLWGHGAVITVKFLNETKNADLMNRIVSYAKEWEQYAGIEFKFVEKADNALVRIGFDWNANRWVTWSYIGSDAKMVTNQAEATASFADFDNRYITEEEIRADVLRVFGQVLGLEYEQRHLGWDQDWWLNVQKYWETEIEDVPWSVLKEYVVTPLSGKNIVSTEEIDLESIMIYPYGRREVAEVLVNYNLSAGDKAFIAKLYPKELPTIQEAWVDAGFFEWVTEDPKSFETINGLHGFDFKFDGKPYLRPTALGQEQEYLPNVSDGEQLTTGYNMFQGMTYLKEVPKFNTSNILDFNYMFQSCESLKTMPDLDYSKGVTFYSTFYGLKSIPAVDNMNFPNAIDVTGMFSLGDVISVSNLSFPKVKNMSGIFGGSPKLLSVANLELPTEHEFNGALFGYTPWVRSVTGVNVSNMDQAYLSRTFDEFWAIETLEIAGLGENCVEDDYHFPFIGIPSAVLDIYSLYYIIDNTTGATSKDPYEIHLHKKFENELLYYKDLVAKAKSKNFVFICDLGN